MIPFSIARAADASGTSKAFVKDLFASPPLQSVSLTPAETIFAHSEVFPSPVRRNFRRNTPRISGPPRPRPRPPFLLVVVLVLAIAIENIQRIKTDSPREKSVQIIPGQIEL